MFLLRPTPRDETLYWDELAQVNQRDTNFKLTHIESHLAVEQADATGFADYNLLRCLHDCLNTHKHHHRKMFPLFRKYSNELAAVNKAVELSWPLDHVAKISRIVQSEMILVLILTNWAWSVFSQRKSSAKSLVTGKVSTNTKLTNKIVLTIDW